MEKRRATADGVGTPPTAPFLQSKLQVRRRPATCAQAERAYQRSAGPCGWRIVRPTLRPYAASGHALGGVAVSEAVAAVATKLPEVQNHDRC